MATKRGEDNKRLSINPLHDSVIASQAGNVFVTHTGHKWNSDSATVLHNGIDTIKQLYKGFLKVDRFNAIQLAYADKCYQLEIGGIEWSVKSASRGGYHYSLNNRDLGIVVLVGDFHGHKDFEGHHLKIELSPWFILDKNINLLQTCIDEIANIFIHSYKYSGVAIHICADVQGWTPPNDLDQRLITRAHRVYKYSGALECEIEWQNHTIATVYGKGETFTFGGAGSIQFSVYNKTKLINKNDTVKQYWHDIYKTKTRLIDNGDFLEDVPLFDIKKPVYRLESRFHQSVIQQFARGLGVPLVSFAQISSHLTGLWQYSLNNFRLDSSPTYIDPFWQFLRDDIEFNHDRNALEYRRIYKQTDFDAPPSDRVLKIIFGLLASSYRRLKYNFDFAFYGLKNCGIFDQLIEAYERRNGFDFDYTRSDAYEDIKADLEVKLNPPRAFILIT